MLAVLLNVPKTPADWARFTFHHRSSHDIIRQAIRQKSGSDLPDYVIDPISPNATKEWLAANQQLHIQMDQALGTQSSDLQDVNLQDEHQFQAWIYLHYQEHRTAEDTLGISS